MLVDGVLVLRVGVLKWLLVSEYETVSDVDTLVVGDALADGVGVTEADSVCVSVNVADNDVVGDWVMLAVAVAECNVEAVTDALSERDTSSDEDREAELAGVELSLRVADMLLDGETVGVALTVLLGDAVAERDNVVVSLLLAVDDELCVAEGEALVESDAVRSLLRLCVTEGDSVALAVFDGVAEAVALAVRDSVGEALSVSVLDEVDERLSETLSLLERDAVDDRLIVPLTLTDALQEALSLLVWLTVLLSESSEVSVALCDRLFIGVGLSLTDASMEDEWVNDDESLVEGDPLCDGVRDGDNESLAETSRDALRDGVSDCDAEDSTDSLAVAERDSLEVGVSVAVCVTLSLTVLDRETVDVWLLSSLCVKLCDADAVGVGRDGEGRVLVGDGVLLAEWLPSPVVLPVADRVGLGVSVSEASSVMLCVELSDGDVLTVGVGVDESDALASPDTESVSLGSVVRDDVRLPVAESLRSGESLAVELELGVSDKLHVGVAESDALDVPDRSRVTDVLGVSVRVSDSMSLGVALNETEVEIVDSVKPRERLKSRVFVRRGVEETLSDAVADVDGV